MIPRDMMAIAYTGAENPSQLVPSEKPDAIQRVRFGEESERWGKGKCGDCGCAEGKLHRLGCDVERCPLCGGQLTTCACIFAKPIDRGRAT